MIESLNNYKALRYAERYGILDFKVKDNEMIYYASYPVEHATYKCTVDLNKGKETRQQMKRYHKKYTYNA